MGKDMLVFAKVRLRRDGVLAVNAIKDILS